MLTVLRPGVARASLACLARPFSLTTNLPASKDKLVGVKLAKKPPKIYTRTGDKGPVHHLASQLKSDPRLLSRRDNRRDV